MRSEYKEKIACIHCKEERGSTDGIHKNIASPLERLLDVGYRYCPMCGRKIVDNATAERKV